MCFLKDVGYVCGLSSNVSEGGPFLCGVAWILAGGVVWVFFGLGGVYVCVGNPLFFMMSCMVSSSSLYSLCFRW